MICCTVCKYVNRLMLLDKRDWLVCDGGLVEVLLNSNGAKFCWKKNKYPPSFETSAFKHKLNCDCFILTTDFTWTLRFYHTDANIFKM